MSLLLYVLFGAAGLGWLTALIASARFAGRKRQGLSSVRDQLALSENERARYRLNTWLELQSPAFKLERRLMLAGGALFFGAIATVFVLLALGVFGPPTSGRG